MHIKNGEVDSVTCQAIDCGTVLLAPRDLVHILPERELVQRYVDIKRKRLLETDRMTVYCPRLWCQGAAMGSNCPKPSIPLEEMNPPPQAILNVHTAHKTDEEMSRYVGGKKNQWTLDFWNLPHSEKIPVLQKRYGDRLKVCEDCNFAFCKVCKKSWHGEHVDCWYEVSLSKQVADMIRARRKEVHESGEFLEKLVLLLERQQQEDDATEAFIERNTTRCPRCYAPMDKYNGCNHMTCPLCHGYFCYLCGEEFKFVSNHFLEAGSPCYQKLFAQPQTDEELFRGVRGDAFRRQRAEEEDQGEGPAQ